MLGFVLQRLELLLLTIVQQLLVFLRQVLSDLRLND